MKNIFHPAWGQIFQEEKSRKDKDRDLANLAVQFRDHKISNNSADQMIAEYICRRYSLPAPSWAQNPDADFFAFVFQVMNEVQELKNGISLTLPTFTDLLLKLEDDSRSDSEKLSVLENLWSYGSNPLEGGEPGTTPLEHQAKQLSIEIRFFRMRQIPEENWIQLVPECISVACLALKRELDPQSLNDYQVALTLKREPTEEVLPEYRIFLKRMSGCISELEKDPHFNYLINRPLN